MIRNYRDFIEALTDAGFSGAVGGSDDGVFALFRYGWGADAETGIVWHTGDPDHDPWEWRMRVLDERDDISYGKVFFGKAGYITKEWAPFFLAARREGRSFNDIYADGTVSYAAKRVYGAVAKRGALPLQEIKREAGFSREEKPAFDRALTELQGKLFLTMCGQEHQYGGSGWSSTVFCTTETFWGGSVFGQAEQIRPEDAFERIRAQILRLNPNAPEKKMTKFILG
ncbi:MAG: hypothetical protein LBR72_00735 [Oscillospiraceae bacterium]|jgi:hypothetical protein|nr:hypothetical protein [Oscillospiraceae bacterium]